MYIYIYICIYLYVRVCIYIYIYICSQLPQSRAKASKSARCATKLRASQLNRRETLQRSINTGDSSDGRASDCRMVQISDGPWFDSGSPDKFLSVCSSLEEAKILWVEFPLELPVCWGISPFCNKILIESNP